MTKMGRSAVRNRGLLAVREALESEPNLSEVEAFAETLKAAYLECRDVGHAWKPRSILAYRAGGYWQMHRCTRCHTERHRDLTSWGEILRVTMKYPEGYLAEGTGRIMGRGRGVLRVAAAKRSVTSDRFADDPDPDSED